MIYLGADHNGYKIKEAIKKYLDQRNMSFVDLGANELVKDDDYPDYAHAVASRVIKSKNNRGILLCGSGNGMAIAANRFKGARAALAWNSRLAKLAASHDHANILVIPAWFLGDKSATALTAEWLKTAPSRAARHKRRLAKIDKPDIK